MSTVIPASRPTIDAGRYALGVQSQKFATLELVIHDFRDVHLLEVVSNPLSVRGIYRALDKLGTDVPVSTLVVISENMSYQMFLQMKNWRDTGYPSPMPIQVRKLSVFDFWLRVKAGTES